MSPSMAATVHRMEFSSSTCVVGDPRHTPDFKHPTIKNLPDSNLVILRATESYNRDLSLGLRWKIPKGTSWRRVQCGAGHHPAWRWQKVFPAMQSWSCKIVRYRFAVTVQVLLPDTGQGSSKKKDPRIIDAVKQHQTVIWEECRGWL